MDITGNLVKLRAPEPEDAPAAAALHADPEFARFAGPMMLFPDSAAAAAERIRRRRPDSVAWTVECLEDGANIGACSLFRIDSLNRNCWFGIGLGPPSRWGRGYGTETSFLAAAFAFGQLGMEKVYLGVFEGNQRGVRAYRRAGFEVEAEMPRDHLVEGRLVTTYLMAAYRDGPLYNQT